MAKNLSVSVAFNNVWIRLLDIPERIVIVMLDSSVLRMFIVKAAFAVIAFSVPLAVGINTASAQNPVYCPVDGKYYQLRFSDQWNDARQVASRSSWQNRPGRLAIVDRLDVRAWIFENFKASKPGFVYIGGYREGDITNKGWVWLATGAPAVNMGPGWWSINEPNNTAKLERFLSMNFGDGGRFNDISGGARRPFLVQY
jgi:hypothetical protein